MFDDFLDSFWNLNSFKIASKIIKIFFFIQFLLFKWLESRGILIIDWNRLTMGLVGKKENLIEQSESLVTSLMEMGTFGMSIMIGIFLVSKITK